jgi:hypothetical protein
MRPFSLDTCFSVCTPAARSLGARHHMLKALEWAGPELLAFLQLLAEAAHFHIVSRIHKRDMSCYEDSLNSASSFIKNDFGHIGP